MQAAPERLLCGVDEAGRGPIAGPVFAAAVLLDPRRPILGLTDSKLLTQRRRAELAQRIRGDALSWAVACASVEEIDRFNILQASLLAMRRAVEALDRPAQEAWIDGTHCPDLPCPARAIIGGDRTVPQISAASILAKTARDAEMLRLHAQFPQYGLDRHKGYPTPEHLARLAEHGACVLHRRSFAPVRRVLAR
ncbi:MAG: ribonuclease HII [Betaproteobacteria bacterium]|nr:ribonuclease HII [Betaproteobacteria bacterium]MDH5221283.1 ribonuclease HII [Betaproteobacteria bacterium]MDH5350325.1 ribonuclease HII [Betaproteobacteria bacterium]